MIKISPSTEGFFIGYIYLITNQYFMRNNEKNKKKSCFG